MMQGTNMHQDQQQQSAYAMPTMPARMSAVNTSSEAWIPPPPPTAHSRSRTPSPSPYSTSHQHQLHPQPHQSQNQFQQPRPHQQQQHPNLSSASLGSAASNVSHHSNTSSPANPYLAQKPGSSPNLTPSPLGVAPQRTSPRKMTAGSSPLALSSPLAISSQKTRIKPKTNMPTILPPESVCECFICHAASPYSQHPPPEIPVNQRQDLSRLAPTCPSIHLYCMASRLPMSLPLDATQKSPLTRSILDYFYSTWIQDESDPRGPRVQCLNFIPIHPITASCFDRYLEGQSWNKRLCRPLWHAADLRCKLGMEGMYRNCMQDKCASCFIFNDGFENTIAKNKFVYLTPHSSRAHQNLVGSRPAPTGSDVDSYEQDNKVQSMILTFAALGRSFDVPPSNDKMKRPPKGWDVLHRQYEGQGMGRSSEGGDEYGVFAADAIIPLAMILYKVI